ncbi:MAG: hypothetical protein ACOY0T_40135 [Myxococcota bacterium]
MPKLDSSRWLVLLVWGMAACGGPQKAAKKGAVCFRDDDCTLGLICAVPQGATGRVCTDDVAALISEVDAGIPAAGTSAGGGVAGSGAGASAMAGTATTYGGTTSAGGAPAMGGGTATAGGAPAGMGGAATAMGGAPAGTGGAATGGAY